MRFDPQLEAYRVRKGTFSTVPGSLYGAFDIPFRTVVLTVVADSGMPPGLGWEHVSVSLPNRCPNWEEMCHVKSLFWDDDETVLQFHPCKSEYVNFHKHCLHLWRKVGTEPELPPRICV